MSPPNHRGGQRAAATDASRSRTARWLVVDAGAAEQRAQVGGVEVGVELVGELGGSTSASISPASWAPRDRSPRSGRATPRRGRRARRGRRRGGRRTRARRGRRSSRPGTAGRWSTRASRRAARAPGRGRAAICSAGSMTVCTKIARAARIVASWSSSLVPKCAIRPLLLIASSVASRPMESPSRPSTEARSTARASTTRRVRSPRRTRPSVGRARRSAARSSCAQPSSRERD